MPISTVGLTLISLFTYRGVNEEYSNQYWFGGSTPADATAWKALADAVILTQKAIVLSRTKVIRAMGHNDPDPHAANVFIHDYLALGTEVAGTLNSAGGTVAPGDAAVWARWKTNRLNSKGKPVYLRKYFHDAISVTGTGDTILPAQKTALEAHAVKMFDGTLPAARKIVSPEHNTDLVISSGASAYLTTRTLKRRGKRNPT